MTMQNPQPKPEPKPEPMSEQDAEALLPWYANGRTSHAEARAIEAALQSSSGLRAQLEAVRRERSAVIETTDEAGSPSPENLQRLLKQLGTTRQFPPVRAAEAGPLTRFLGGLASRHVLQFALAAACLAIVVEGVALYRAPSTGDAVYSTASGPSDAAAGPRLIVVFQPTATVAAIQQLLGGIDASIVKGPTPDGGYVIALPENADSDALVRQLQSHGDLIASVAKGS